MSRHIDTMRRAIEFGKPPIIPLEWVDVPLVYDAYGTLDPATVSLPPPAADFDSAWVTYHWIFEELGHTPDGERRRRDEWGCTHVVPHDMDIAYTIVEHPDLTSIEAVAAHPWPDPRATDPFFARRREILEQYYPDRFICGFLDPGPFLIAFNLLGYDGLLLALGDDIERVKAVLRRIVDYQLALIPKFAAMGAHMVNLIDEVAGTTGLMFDPELFRRHFLPYYRELLEAIHAHDMYASVLFDGNIRAILPDLMAMDWDQLFFAQPLSTGLDVIAETCAGRRCVKLAVDMMQTLSLGSPGEIEAQVDEFVRRFHTPDGGLVFQAMRWHRPTFADHRVEAQLRAMNRYRSS